jgi:hypothetical protein
MDISLLLNPGPTPRTTRFRSGELSRDEKVECLALRKYIGLSYYEIAQKTDHSVRQVQHACTTPLTPKKNQGRKGSIRTPEKRLLDA